MMLESKRIRFIRYAVLGAFLFSFAISWQLWLPGRAFPLAPLIPEFTLPHSLQYLLLFLLLNSIILSFKQVWSKITLPAAIVLIITLWLLDANRLYPSFYEYTCFFFLFAYYLNRPKSFSREKIEQLLIIMIAGVYIWTGMSKLTPSFLITWDWLISPLRPYLDSGFVSLIGIVAPIMEIAAGICLVFVRSRKVGVWLAVLIHVPLLFLIGPLRPWNIAAWSWNVASLVFVVLIGWQNNTSLKSFALKKLPKPIWPIFFLYTMLPALGLFGWFDPALSFNVYSGNHSQGTAYVSATDLKALPTDMHTYFSCEDNECNVMLFYWAQEVFQGGPQPGIWVLYRTFHNLCMRSDSPESLRLEIKKQQYWGRSQQYQTLHCTY